MKRTRYEILLPLRYNDGERIEKVKFTQTQRDILEQFGAVTVDSVGVIGTWVYQGVQYEDKLIRLIVDVLDEEEAEEEFFVGYKEQLKERFRQIDIWISSHTINVI